MRSCKSVCVCVVEERRTEREGHLSSFNNLKVLQPSGVKQDSTPHTVREQRKKEGKKKKKSRTEKRRRQLNLPSRDMSRQEAFPCTSRAQTQQGVWHIVLGATHMR